MSPLGRFRFLAALLRHRPWQTLVNLLIGAAFLVISLVPGLAIREFFNALATPDPAATVLLAALAVFVGVKTGNAVVGTVRMVIDCGFRFGISTQLRESALARLLARPGAVPMRCATGDALSRLRDDVIDVAETLGKRGLTNVTSSLSFAGCAFSVMLAIDVRVTLLAVLPTLGVAVVSFLASKQVKRLRSQNRRTAGEVSGLLREVFAGIEAVKLAGAGPRILSRVAAANLARRRAAVRDGGFDGVLRASSGSVVAIGTGLIMVVAGSAISAGRFSIGDLALFIYCLKELGIGVEVVGRFLSQYQRVEVARRRLAELVPSGHDGDLLSPAPPPRIARHRPFESLTVRDLSYHHPDGTPGLREVGFDLIRGQVTVVAGRIGSGKTTLVRVLLGLLPHSDGEIRWNGDPVPPGVGPLWPPHAAYTPQTPRVFSESVTENVMLGVPDGEDRLPAVLRDAALDGDLARMPDGPGTVVGPRGHRLSGGQLHRLAAARMLARAADLYVVDDLSAALDVTTEARLWERLLDSSAGRSFLIVSNRRTVLRRADQVLVMSGGGLAAAGPLDEALESSPELRRIWDDGGH